MPENDQDPDSLPDKCTDRNVPQRWGPAPALGQANSISMFNQLYGLVRGNLLSFLGGPLRAQDKGKEKEEPRKTQPGKKETRY